MFHMMAKGSSCLALRPVQTSFLIGHVGSPEGCSGEEGLGASVLVYGSAVPVLQPAEHDPDPAATAMAPLAVSDGSASLKLGCPNGEFPALW